MIQTLDYQNIGTAGKLTLKKKLGGQRISVVIPAINESSTIGHIVECVVDVGQKTGLVDEVFVIDSDSTDSTAAIAEAAGATVFRTSSICPEITLHGKGAAMWKSQFVTTGDIIVFIDADILDFTDRFIVGLAGALIDHPELELVKASYRRPLIAGSQRIDDFGGRVTELLARPLINYFLPELSFLRQPLAGEFAVRKEMLSGMPMYPGYGVEMGILLEHYFTRGIDSIAQVEMGLRTHRNRDLLDLSKMAFEIEHVFFNYLEQHGCCEFTTARNTTLTTWHKDHWESYHIIDKILVAQRTYADRMKCHA